MLYVIGLGLGDEKDITLRGLEAIKKCSKVYMEAYTSLLSFGLTSDGLSTLEKVYGKPIIVADREMVEEKADDILLEAQVTDVAFLVVGDPFGNWLYRYGETDIRVKEPSLESLCRGKKVYEPPRFMTINTAIEQLLEVAQNHGESVYNEDTTCVGMARIGCEEQVIVAGSMKQLLDIDFGSPLHCLVIVGDTHPLEEEMIDFYKTDTSLKNT
ncbi:hypothetical protein OROGR_026371 [Orobanche gracilis]